MDPAKKTLGYFLENKNFPSTKRVQRKKKVATEEDSVPTESLIVVDGQIVINDIKDRETPIEDRVTSFSYGKSSTSRTRWTKEETLLFYQALSLCGTDFTLLEEIFTDKTRKQIKNKFSKEERTSPELISHALTQPTKKFSKNNLDKLKQEYADLKSN
ncbi:hypothetical protein NEOKW01_1502 [Nematocida sp. AWRm80]|nr:hypothetical protein NEOKW01_1502 [Nematocida sp. AWRm80]